MNDPQPLFVQHYISHFRVEACITICHGCGTALPIGEEACLFTCFLYGRTCGCAVKLVADLKQDDDWKTFEKLHIRRFERR